MPISINTQAATDACQYATLQQQSHATLLSWQCPLYGSLCKVQPTNNLYQCLQLQLPVLLVSNGSVQKNGQSGFAWIFAHEMTQLSHGQELAPGPVEDMHSDRVEAFGLLTALTFLSYYLLCYTPLTTPTTLQCFCDNMGVITNIMLMQDSMINHPNNTTNDDQDLFLANVAIIPLCALLKLQFLHVLRHQDTMAQ